MSDQPVSFARRWVADLHADVDHSGAFKLVPVWLIASLAIGFGASFSAPNNLWVQPANGDVATRLELFGAMLTFDGLLLAVAFASFTKFLDVATGPGFSSYLEKVGLLETYFFMMDYTKAAQYVAALITFFCLIGSLFTARHGFWLVAQKVGLSGSVGFSLYATKYAVGSVSMMQDLVRARIKFEKFQLSGNGDRSQIRSV